MPLGEKLWRAARAAPAISLGDAFWYVVMAGAAWLLFYVLLKRAIPKAALAVLPRSGHAINLEEPALFNELLGDFLHQVDAGRWPARDPSAAPASVWGPGGRPKKEQA